jgi:hypothetical protein
VCDCTSRREKGNFCDGNSRVAQSTQESMETQQKRVCALGCITGARDVYKGQREAHKGSLTESTGALLPRCLPGVFGFIC